MCFPVSFAQFFKNIYTTEHLWMAPKEVRNIERPTETVHQKIV